MANSPTNQNGAIRFDPQPSFLVSQTEINVTGGTTQAEITREGVQQPPPSWSSNCAPVDQTRAVRFASKNSWSFSGFAWICPIPGPSSICLGTFSTEGIQCEPNLDSRPFGDEFKAFCLMQPVISCLPCHSFRTCCFVSRFSMCALDSV